MTGREVKVVDGAVWVDFSALLMFHLWTRVIFLRIGQSTLTKLRLWAVLEIYFFLFLSFFSIKAHDTIDL